MSDRVEFYNLRQMMIRVRPLIRDCAVRLRMQILKALCVAGILSAPDVFVLPPNYDLVGDVKRQLGFRIVGGLRLRNPVQIEASTAASGIVSPGRYALASSPARNSRLEADCATTFSTAADFWRIEIAR